MTYIELVGVIEGCLLDVVDNSDIVAEDIADTLKARGLYLEPDNN